MRRRHGERQATIAHYQLALRSNANHRKAHLYLGSALELAPEELLARDALQRALQLRATRAP